VPLRGSPTAEALRRAFTSEAEATVRLLYFARRADVEGEAEVAALLRAVADGELGQAFGHLEFLEEAEDPITGTGDTAGNLGAVIESELEAAETDYPEVARVARAGGFADVAEWFDSLAAAEAAHATQLRRLHGA
jgi:rubrerythrin